MSLKDSDNIARLEKLKARYEKLRDLKIRADADVERALKDHEAAKERARAIAGTDNEDEIRAKIRANYEANTKAVDEFEKILDDIEAKLTVIGGQE